MTEHTTSVPGVTLIAVLLIAVTLPVSAAEIFLVNLDPQGEGFNDPTPVAPVGGNPGTTIGEQRAYAYLFAAEIWGDTLESSETILAGATFQRLPCTLFVGTLAAAGPTYMLANFPGAGFADTWYSSAQADALAGADLNPGALDVISYFNSDIDDDANCLAGTTWYYGFDNNPGNDVDFLTVVLHELAHGLGFLELVDEATGELFVGRPDIYTRFMLDLDLNATWDTLTDAERLASQVNSRNLVWSGSAVTAEAPSFLGPRPSVQIRRPACMKGSWEVRPAAFGPSFDLDGGTAGPVVLVDDGVGVGSDGCEPIRNDLDGKIALIDRGACPFTVKVANAEAAGARGAIVVNNVPGGPAPMAGSDPTIGIPSAGATLELGDYIKTGLPSVVARLVFDDDHLIGTTQGFVRLHAPDPVASGASKSHWDTTVEPSLLMEPRLTPRLESARTRDLTPSLLQDLGWVLRQ